jgi:hypothetical protein
MPLTLAERQAHYDTYEALLQERGVSAVTASIPFSAAEVAAALGAGDEHLNTLRLPAWDHACGWYQNQRTGNIRALGETPPWMRGLSLGQGVCLLKHAARKCAGLGRPA